MNELFQLPKLGVAPRPSGWAEETLTYRVKARPKPKFKSVLDPKELFGSGERTFEVTTKTREPVMGEIAYELVVRGSLSTAELEDRFTCEWQSGLLSSRLERRVGDARAQMIDFRASPFKLPRPTYPEVLLPFLMRGQPRDGKTRAAYSWTSDRFIARVYYESRKKKVLDLPAGRIEVIEVWMYPDLNDWIALGGIITKLAKPLLPRYDIWFEVAPPHRVARFEGPYGPPGAPELVLELA